MVAISSWGRLSNWSHEVKPLHDRDSLVRTLVDGAPGIAYGMGRSYGDVCLNPGGTLWSTRGLDRFIRFDPDTGLLECEAGVLLRDIQVLAVPRGWMLPVTPGTWFVTVGGAVANDVHGKNQHRFGSFGDHLQGLSLVRTDGEIIECGPDQRANWFAATVGGMGLTGIISRVTLALRPVAGPWLDVESIPYGDLDDFFALADDSERDWEYTVSWIDCAAWGKTRGIFYRANHSERQAPAPKPSRLLCLPLTPPISLVNKLSLRPFNTLYFHMKKWGAGRGISHYERFFYPLDTVGEWNRMYGPRGFYQYQCVIPPEHRRAAMEDILKEIADSGIGSFLAVLKTFGDRQAPGMLSFPRPGVTLALDFPNLGECTVALMARLDRIVAESGGRIYAAKDACMSREMYATGYPRLQEFESYRDEGISSALSRRLLGS